MTDMQHNTIRFNPEHRSAGFTLVEIMIAVLVLSIGLLGLAGLQANSLRFNSDSSIQTQATYLANDIVDRMRANPSVAAAYTNTAPAQNTACYNAGGCSPTAMVGNDLWEWNLALNALPAGQGVIAALAGGVYQITLRWDERRNGAAGLGCNPDNLNDLRCLVITTQP